MNKMRIIVNLASVIMFLLAIITALVVRFTYKDSSSQYDKYKLFSECSLESFENILDEYNIDNFEDIYNSASLAVIVNFSGEREVYKENVSYIVEAETILKGNINENEKLKILEYTVFDVYSNTVSCLYGNVPFITNSKYLLLLNEQEQHGTQSEKTYYITTQSPLGKYLINGKAIIVDNNQFNCELKEYDNVAFIAKNKEVKERYIEFYDQAAEYIGVSVILE